MFEAACEVPLDRNLCLSVPHTQTGAQPVNFRDYMSLAMIPKPQWLTDNLVEFISKTKLNSIPEADQANVQLFPTNFFVRLQSPPSDNPAMLEEELKLPEHMREHSRVHRYVKNIKLSEKKYMIFQVVDGIHWYVMLVARLRQKQPLIVLLDSLHWQHDASMLSIRNFLKTELCNEGINPEFTFIQPLMPRQLNTWDCGLFAAEYISNFLNNPESFLDCALSNTLQNIFEPKSMECTRVSVASFIQHQAIIQLRVLQTAAWPDLGFTVPQPWIQALPGPYLPTPHQVMVM